jgi:hypothetical protein
LFEARAFRGETASLSFDYRAKKLKAGTKFCKAATKTFSLDQKF